MRTIKIKENYITIIPKRNIKKTGCDFLQMLVFYAKIGVLT